LSLLLAHSVNIIRGLHSLVLLMAHTFQYICHAAQSSPLITLCLNIPAAPDCQHASLPVPVEEKTEAGISLSSPFVNPVWSIYCTAHSGGLPKERQPPPFSCSKLPFTAIQSGSVFQYYGFRQRILPR
jgi:hypothetical protein